MIYSLLLLTANLGAINTLVIERDPFQPVNNCTLLPFTGWRVVGIANIRQVQRAWLQESQGKVHEVSVGDLLLAQDKEWQIINLNNERIELGLFKLGREHKHSTGCSSTQQQALVLE